MRNNVFVVILCLSTILLSCHGNPGTEQMVNDSTLPEPVKSEELMPEKEKVQVRKIIKEGEIEFRSKNILQTTAYITKIIQEEKGYISNESSNQFSDRMEHRMILRIPAEGFDRVLHKISEEAGNLERKIIEVQDVSEEYIDIQARMKTKKELLVRYTALLKKAVKVDEILNIEKEMGVLQSEIESVEGRLNYLDDRVAFSTLQVIFYAEKATVAGFTMRLGKAVKNGWDGFLLFIIGLVNFWVFILISLILFIFFRKWKGRKKADRLKG